MGTQPNLSPSPGPRRFKMRPLEMADIDAVSNWFAHLEDISIFDRQSPVPANKEETIQILKDINSDGEKNKSRWYFVEDSEGQPVGMCGLESINQLHGNAILPVFVAKKFRRSGVGIRMVSMMLDLAFRQLRLHRVNTVYRHDNEASAALVLKCGFTVEGVARESWFSNGQFMDSVNVGILAPEWDAARAALAESMDPAIVLDLGDRPSGNWQWPDKKQG